MKFKRRRQKSNRQLLLTQLFLVLLLFIGIGYSVLNTALGINGTLQLSKTKKYDVTKLEEIKASDNTIITTSNDEDYIFFDIDLKEIGDIATYNLNIDLNLIKRYRIVDGKTIKAILEESADNSLFTSVKEITIEEGTNELISNLESPAGKKYYRLSLNSENENLNITHKNMDIELDIKTEIISMEKKYSSSLSTGTTGSNFIVPTKGNYKLEVWGAQGGKAKYCKETTEYFSFTCKEGQLISYEGGKGGYAAGNIDLNSKDILYIKVGENGGYYSYLLMEFSIITPTNGGGDQAVCDNNSVGGGGGDATHIATKSGSLASLSSSKQSILIVAGGGGGAKAHKSGPSYSGNGGVGGGLTGGNASPANTTCYSIGLGGSQTAAGGNRVCTNDGREYSSGSNKPDLIAGFGQGGNYSKYDYDVCRTYAGGGGGYYGGAAGYHAPGGGGSSYIGGVTNGVTIAGNNAMPTLDGNSTMIGSSSGAAKIKLLENNEIDANIKIIKTENN